jgi:two-component system response regulator PilR (NtrC family)
VAPPPLSEPASVQLPSEQITPSSSPPPSVDTNLESYLEELEKEAITKALEATRYNKTAAAEKLGITFRALRYRLKKLGID